MKKGRENVVHVVRSGETLWAISNLYKVSASTILNLNGLTNAEIVPGLALYIPTIDLNLRHYLIAPSDIIWHIAAAKE